MNRVYYENLGNTSEGVVGLHMGYQKMTKMAKKTNDTSWLKWQERHRKKTFGAFVKGYSISKNRETKNRLGNFFIYQTVKC